MFGIEKTLPIDLVFCLDIDEKSRTLTKYISYLQKRLEEAYRSANAALNHSQLRQQYSYNQKAKRVVLKIRDKVLHEVKYVAFDCKHKLADRWGDNPNIIIQEANSFREV